MKLLAIETSCDETAVSVLECGGGFEAPKIRVLGTGLYSQAATHAEFGGVYPMLAKREHQRNLVPLLQKALREAGLEHPAQHSNIQLNVKVILEREQELLQECEKYIPTIEKPDIDAIAVTQGPGLEPALWVGLNFAKALSHAWNIPLIPTNHMEGHVWSVLSQADAAGVRFPALALLVSGGHTELVLTKGWLAYEMLGQTRDDAVGEAFDKVARLLGLPYPGGPEISKLAAAARAGGADAGITLPRPMLASGDYDFSFAGLKTAVLYMTKKLEPLSDDMKMRIAREFEDAAVEVLVEKTRRALEEFNVATLIVAGGVVANAYLREEMQKMVGEQFPDVALRMPTRELATDNAVMIGIAGYLRFVKDPKDYIPYSPERELRAQGTMRLSESRRIEDN